jgi:hypothetical protein
MTLLLSIAIRSVNHPEAFIDSLKLIPFFLTRKQQPLKRELSTWFPCHFSPPY